MPKHKPHKGLLARVRITRTGRVMRRRAGKSHLMSKKSGRKRRQLSRTAQVQGRCAKIIKARLAGS